MSSISACKSHFFSLSSFSKLFQETHLRKPSLLHCSINNPNSFIPLRFQFLPSSFKTSRTNVFLNIGELPNGNREVKCRGFGWGQQEEASDGVGEEGVAEAKIFVGNLPFDVDSEKLAHIFDKAGIVEVAEVIYKQETDLSRGFGFVTMSSVEEAEKAVEMFNRYDLNGRLLTVNKAASRGSKPPPRTGSDFVPSFRIYVGNLPWQVDNARLEQLFSEHGKVVDARVVFDRDSGQSRGFGFVTMSTKNELDDAVAALDGKSLDGRPIRVNIAEERPRRSF